MLVLLQISYFVDVLGAPRELLIKLINVGAVANILFSWRFIALASPLGMRQRFRR